MKLKHEQPVRETRNRFHTEPAARCALLAVLWLALSFLPHSRLLCAGLLVLLVVIPELIFHRIRRKSIAKTAPAMEASKQSAPLDPSTLPAPQGAIQRELANSKTYIDVMNAQIGGSLAETERAVAAIIREIEVLQTRALEQQRHIAQSVARAGKLSGDPLHPCGAAGIMSVSPGDAEPQPLEESRPLRELIAQVDGFYAESVHQLSVILGHIQFHDVMGQRMEHVQEALMEMRDHLLDLSLKMLDPDWNGALEVTLQQILDAHLGRYRMASQTETHLSIAGATLSQPKKTTAIELF